MEKKFYEMPLSKGVNLKAQYALLVGSDDFDPDAPKVLPGEGGSDDSGLGD